MTNKIERESEQTSSRKIVFGDRLVFRNESRDVSRNRLVVTSDTIQSLTKNGCCSRHQSQVVCRYVFADAYAWRPLGKNA